MRRPQVVVRLAFPTWALETKAVFQSGMSTWKDGNWECSKTVSLRPLSEEAPVLDLLHDYCMPAAKSALLWRYMVVVILLKGYHLKWIIS